MSKKIIFMGTSPFAVPILEALCKSIYTVRVVYTQPAKKSARGLKINKSPIQVISEKLNKDWRTPKSFENNDQEYEFIKKMDADLAIVVAYGQIIPKKYLGLTKKGFINIHGSILPKWRGAAPIQRAIMNLDNEIGISIMKMNEKLDSGPVSNIYKIKLDQNKNAQEISNELSLLAATKILDCVKDILEDRVKFIDQEHSKASYAKKIDKIEGKINWKEDSRNIIGKINSLFPFPGAFFMFNGERYKILKGKTGSGSGKPGEVLSNDLEIACKKNQSIKVLVIQREGKKPQKINEFMLGSKIKKGSTISNV